ncbi:hypothetical protein Nepgr_012868 [Nepenthes gracilis]|uniref:Uncharacterized protein n=1 Tax=Nepenthes gracilis TaxID=150966 RepID=A0AAD3SI08_NEPGR|nr:hypothetical protein Nepgr_012868 [Nepenthes gracilis]
MESDLFAQMKFEGFVATGWCYMILHRACQSFRAKAPIQVHFGKLDDSVDFLYVMHRGCIPTLLLPCESFSCETWTMFSHPWAINLVGSSHRVGRLTGNVTSGKGFAVAHALFGGLVFLFELGEGLEASCALNAPIDWDELLAQAWLLVSRSWFDLQLVNTLQFGLSMNLVSGNNKNFLSHDFDVAGCQSTGKNRKLLGFHLKYTFTNAVDMLS